VPWFSKSGCAVVWLIMRLSRAIRTGRTRRVGRTKKRRDLAALVMPEGLWMGRSAMGGQGLVQQLVQDTGKSTRVTTLQTLSFADYKI